MEIGQEKRGKQNSIVSCTGKKDPQDSVSTCRPRADASLSLSKTDRTPPLETSVPHSTPALLQTNTEIKANKERALT